MAISQETRGVLILLIGGIKKILKEPEDKIFKLNEIDQLLEVWVKSNGLYLEDFEELTTERFAEKYGLSVAKKE